jgi:competence protein ComEC
MAQRGRAGGRALPWPLSGAWQRPALTWPRGLSDFVRAAVEHLQKWALADVGPGRLIPWLPIAFGTGIVIYFGADREPAWWAGPALTAACLVAAIALRRRPVAFPVALAATAMAAGFATATLKTIQVAHPVLQHSARTVEIAGFIEVREERERTDRIVVRVHRIEGGRLNETPDRVRLSVRKGTAPSVGTFVTLKTRLSPPLSPLRPGGYDFARDLYFQGVGATGLALGSIQTGEPPTARGLRLSYAAAISGLRDAIDSRIRAAVPGDKGAIASALITGKRDAISAPVNDAMYISSLAHVLSISGYHMVLVAGGVFFVVRALLALVPMFALRYPIKKWAALAALGAAAFYLLLSGAEVATQRAFIMTAIVLLAVMVDRSALTLRTLAVAALAVMLFAPQAVVHPSFQMSFAATLALIAAYERGTPWALAGAHTSFGARVALWGGREVISLVLASLVAGLATTIFAAYHFHRLAPYGVLANLLAMPIVSIWVMPMGLFALAASPFGFDGPLWWLMGEGIGWMIAVALWVASLPGAVGRISAFGTGPLLLGTAGLILLCLLKTPLRWSGAALVVIAGLWAARTPLPDVLVAADGRAAAVRGADGRLSIVKTGSDSFAARTWLAADGDARSARDTTLPAGFTCDEAGCIGRLPDGRLVSFVLLPEAFEEDCRRAAVVVSARDAPPDCAALVIDRKISRSSGAVDLRRVGTGFAMTAAKPPGSERPWMRGAPAQSDTTRPVPTAARTPQRDATPRTDDLEPGD